MGYEPPRIEKTGLNIIGFQPWIILKNCLGRITRRQHPEDVLHCQTPSTNDRFAAKNLWVY